MSLNCICDVALSDIESSRDRQIRWFPPDLYPESQRVLNILNEAFEKIKKEPSAWLVVKDKYFLENNHLTTS